MGIYEADSAELIEFAQLWADMGTSVQEQVVAILDQGEDVDVNVNAVKMAVDTIGGKNNEIDVALEES